MKTAIAFIKKFIKEPDTLELKDGNIIAQNKNIIISHPFPVDFKCSVDPLSFMNIISYLKSNSVLTLTDSYLCVKNEDLDFKISLIDLKSKEIPCFYGEYFEIDKYRNLISNLIKFSSTKIIKEFEWMSGICFEDDFIFSANNSVYVRKEFKNPFGKNICIDSRILKKILTHIYKIQFNDYKIKFLFKNGAFFICDLLPPNWNIPKELLKESEFLQKVDTDFFKSVKLIGKNTSRIIFSKYVMHDYKKIIWKNHDFGNIKCQFDIKEFTKLDGIAEEIDFKNNPHYFKGAGFSGFIYGY
jgi:hypothetical protein